MKTTTNQTRRRNIAVKTTFAGAVTALLGYPTLAHAQTTNITIPKAAISTAFNAALAGTRVRVHNLGARNGASWLDDKSHVLLPDGRRTYFKVPEQSFRFRGTNRHLKHYVNDLNSSSVKAFVDRGHLKLLVAFESQGEEVKGKCVRRGGPAWRRRWRTCSLQIERDLHLDNARAEVGLVPVAYNGSISYRVAHVKFHSDVRISNRLCRAAKGICGKIERWAKDRISSGVEDTIRKSLKAESTRKIVAEAVRKGAGASRPLIGPNWHVTNVSSQGRNFVVTARRAGSVRRGS